ncbi:MAG: hypothetical protein B6242_13475 [Anaerolineaceae bacterium 4572_78]|nr:MAG: hypothetical protein B6242_13475 [Anaerolineaceae bacterium 4572_78]
MSKHNFGSSKALVVHLELLQYPILSYTIRERMRDELYKRGIITIDAFEKEVEDKAIYSQRREGLTDPLTQETDVIWQQRLAKITESLTDFYFAHNLPNSLLRDIVQQTLHKPSNNDEMILTFNPEMAPWAMLIPRAEQYEKYPSEKWKKVKHHYQEILVVITKGLISDQLPFLGISRKQFTIADLKNIIAHRIGRGKIGGKSAGMRLAYKILSVPSTKDEIDVSKYVMIPKSYYIGADVFYSYLSTNGFLDIMNQKYLSEEEIEEKSRKVRETYLKGTFPESVISKLWNVLQNMDGKPIIVRSSSLLEDRFGTSFAGKYDSFFCPNQGTPEENLADLIKAVKKVYASATSPATLLYRKHMGLLDYDERMAILIQEVVGTKYKNYFFPALAGVGFSRNPFRWTLKIDPKSGFLRLVWGVGTRAVDRVANDYPRMIALSHPLMRPEQSHEAICKYSQHYVDVINLSENSFETVPIAKIIGDDYPSIRYLASINTGEYLKPIIALGSELKGNQLVLTFGNLLKQTNFAKIMKVILQKIERYYEVPVDVEFAVDIIPSYPIPEFKIYLLQCRPLSFYTDVKPPPYPTDVSENDIIFTTTKWVTSGHVKNIEYIVYVDPVVYSTKADHITKHEIGRAIGRINKRLSDNIFILLGPGRWGSSNIDLGVPVTYGDIFNTAILGEIAAASGNENIEVSYGTHFYQDLVEARIYPLPLYPSTKATYFNYDFIHNTHNSLSDVSPIDEDLDKFIKIIHVPHVAHGKKLEVVMDGESERAIGYLVA